MSTFELKCFPRALETSRSYTPSWAFSSTFRKHLHSCPLYACAQLCTCDIWLCGCLVRLLCSLQHEACVLV